MKRGRSRTKISAPHVLQRHGTAAPVASHTTQSHNMMMSRPRNSRLRQAVDSRRRPDDLRQHDDRLLFARRVKDGSLVYALLLLPLGLSTASPLLFPLPTGMFRHATTPVERLAQRHVGFRRSLILLAAHIGAPMLICGRRHIHASALARLGSASFSLAAGASQPEGRWRGASLLTYGQRRFLFCVYSLNYQHESLVDGDRIYMGAGISISRFGFSSPGYIYPEMAALSYVSVSLC